MRAIAAGRVVYADWLPGLGLLAIVDHGGGYLSLYGHNDALRRSAGESVGAGDVIASARRHRRQQPAGAVLRDPPGRQAGQSGALVPAPRAGLGQVRPQPRGHLTQKADAVHGSRGCFRGLLSAEDHHAQHTNPPHRNAKVSDLWSCLEPYAQLAQMLLPRMSGLTVLNARGDILWSNEVMAVNEDGAAGR